ncbi:MAG: exodeoxyribonuclease-3 [Rickettsiales bacterium]|jgi:exodeoxyribonuclease-3
MKIISWNINSVRLRAPLLKQLILEQKPDIICLQETKVQDSEFPLEELKSFGLENIYFSGQKSYNGVAILSKEPLENIRIYKILDSEDKRHISAVTKSGIKIHNFYVPAGGDEPDVNINPKFDFKLKFLDYMVEYFAKNYSKNDKLIMVGDMNVAPLEMDVWSHKQLLKVVSHTAIEVEKMNNLQKTLNWVDSHRYKMGVEERLYSWWSYRAKDPMKSNRGRRLDHIWVTPTLRDNIIDAKFLVDFRVKERPSDHIPIILEMAVEN